jgi:pimeloyl-ACP methyl ester carboxylesterase
MKRQGISPIWRLQALQRRLTRTDSLDDARLIHRDRDLAIAWQPGSSTRLVLVFISIRPGALHPGQLEFWSIASDHGRNHVLFINDRERSWYSAPGLRERIADEVRRFVARHGIEEIWSIGNSLGGYGAILFCDRLPISKVVAFVPQLFMSKEALAQPNWANYVAPIREGVERDLIPIMAAADCRFHIVTGDRFADDLLHMEHLRKMLPDAPKVRIVTAPGQSHYVAKWLKDHGQLAKLVTALWAGDRQGLEDCSKALPQPLDLTLA